jgi:hypothetical protein
VAREAEIVWEPEYRGVAELFMETESTPMDVPLHAGAARFWREHTGA